LNYYNSDLTFSHERVINLGLGENQTGGLGYFTQNDNNIYINVYHMVDGQAQRSFYKIGADDVVTTFFDETYFRVDSATFGDDGSVYARVANYDELNYAIAHYSPTEELISSFVEDEDLFVAESMISNLTFDNNILHRNFLLADNRSRLVSHPPEINQQSYYQFQDYGRISYCRRDKGFYVSGYFSMGQNLKLYSIDDSEMPIDNEFHYPTQNLTCYPNPFNPTTTISFGVKERETAKLEIFNARGQKVRSFGNFNAGTHEVVWNGKNDQDNIVSSGVFFYRLKSETTEQVRKMLLLK